MRELVISLIFLLFVLCTKTQNTPNTILRIFYLVEKQKNITKIKFFVYKIINEKFRQKVTQNKKNVMMIIIE